MSRCPSYLKVAFTVFLVPLTVGCPSKGGSKSPGPSVLPWDYPGYNIKPAIEDSPIKISSFVGSATPELKSIPLIDHTKEDLISEIMNHTYMSHPWMGARFKTVLEGMPGPALRLASCVKLFVLDARQIAAGETDSLVYIGGAYLAQTAEERKLVSGSTPSENSRPDLTYNGEIFEALN